MTNLDNNFRTASLETANRARAKFEAILDRGRARGEEVIKRLEQRPVDRIVNTKAITFEPSEKPNDESTAVDEYTTPSGIVVNIDNERLDMHRHAMNQAVTRTKILTPGMAKKIMNVNQPWAREMLADVMNKTYQNIAPQRTLMREVEGEVRGVLSDKYRRMGSGPIFDAFVRSSMALGAVPTDGKALDTKNTLTMMLPEIFEPIPNEVMLFGATLSNSDFGDGALSLKISVLRVWCSNMCTRDECMRKVHLGKRLDEDMTFSERTYRLDTETNASAVQDVITANMNIDRVNEQMALISAAAEKEVNVNAVFKNLQKTGKISKSEQKQLVDTYNTPDVEMLPPGNNLWRASNTLSLFAQDEGVSNYRSFQLQQMAGDMLDTVVTA